MTWQRVHQTLRPVVRDAEARNPVPSELFEGTVIVACRSVRTTKHGPRSRDAGKKIAGRKRHIFVDSVGLLLAVMAHPAHVQDRNEARLVISKSTGRFP